MSGSNTKSFAELGLPAPLVEALATVGYEAASPIQAATIPALLAGRHVLGQAQTGTGKTAAFALPILARIDPALRTVQALVLVPTRELAIQVSEAFQKYAARLPGFTVLPIYGGQSYGPQLAALKRGVQVVVATPGRTIDHLERGSLQIGALRTVVLDEADEMLRMGFIDDVETILQKTPADKQVALFSATMPPAIRRIAGTYLRDPAEVTIAAKTRTATTVRQRVWMVSGVNKLDALTRILEVEPFEAMLVFARTKVATEELAEKLAARGFAVAALNGDVPQPLRERTVAKLREGSLDIVIATDVAARGLDVERITHVVNYDTPTDSESYVHRIGRTGRAGRSGEAILFIAPRERGLLKMIERSTRQPIAPFQLPTPADVDESRRERFKTRVLDVVRTGSELYQSYRALLGEMEAAGDATPLDLAAALATLQAGTQNVFAKRPAEAASTESPTVSAEKRFLRPAPRPAVDAENAKPKFESKRDARAPARSAPPPIAADVARPPERRSTVPSSTPRPARAKAEQGMVTYRVEVGHQHHIKPGNLVGAIANEAELDSSHIGRIDIHDDYSLIDLPDGMPKHIFKLLQNVWVAGRQLKMSKASGAGPPSDRDESDGGVD